MHDGRYVRPRCGRCARSYRNGPESFIARCKRTVMSYGMKEGIGGATPRSVERWGDVVVRALLDWFDAHGRPFPWRPIDEAGRLSPEMRHDPYIVMVSE